MRRVFAGVVVVVMCAGWAFGAPATDLSLGKAVLYIGATPAEIAAWSTSFAYAGGNLNAKHVAVTADFRLYNGDFSDNECYGLNISTNSLVNIMSPFFLDPTGTTFEWDVDRGDAQWALSYYESRGPLEADYGRTSRNCRPVASYAWGTIANLAQAGNVVEFDLVVDAGLVDGTKSFGVPIGTSGWHVEFDTVSLTGTGEQLVVPEPAGLGLIGVALLALRKRRS